MSAVAHHVLLRVVLSVARARLVLGRWVALEHTR